MNDLFLHPAFLKKNIEEIKFLIKTGATVRISNDFYDSFREIRLDLVVVAVVNNELEPLKLLIQAGADVNSSKPQDGNTPLHYAMAKLDRNRDIEKVLIEAGADLNTKNNKGKTPLQYASTTQRILDEIQRLELELSECKHDNKKHILKTRIYKFKNISIYNSIIDSKYENY